VCCEPAARLAAVVLVMPVLVSPAVGESRLVPVVLSPIWPPALLPQQ